MSLQKKCLSLTYEPLRALTTIASALRLMQPRLRVLMFHDISPNEMSKLEDLLVWLRGSWDFLSPQEFEQVMVGEREIIRDSLLLTFDDGFHSNSIVARDVLRPLGISALFFVITDFVSMVRPDEVRDFINRRLLVNVGEAKCQVDRSNMKWEDLAVLVADGHSIGAHSMSHERLVGGLDLNTLKREIVIPAKEIERILSIRIAHFAFPFGNFGSFSKEAVEMAMDHYKFIHSGIRGINTYGSSRKVIRRDCISPTDRKSLVGSFLLGAADLVYKKHCDVMDSWVTR